MKTKVATPHYETSGVVCRNHCHWALDFCHRRRRGPFRQHIRMARQRVVLGGLHRHFRNGRTKRTNRDVHGCSFSDTNGVIFLRNLVDLRISARFHASLRTSGTLFPLRLGTTSGSSNKGEHGHDHPSAVRSFGRLRSILWG